MASTFSGSAANFDIGSMRFLHGVLSETTASSVTATKADPVVLTATSHGMGATGAVIRVRCTGFTEMTELNNRDFLATVTDANTLTLASEDGSAHGAAESTGGTVTLYTVTDLGYTDESSTLTAGVEFRDRTGDQDGTTVLDKILVGESIELTVGLKEVTPAQWNRITGGVGTLTGASFETGGSLAGSYSAYDNAFILWLHPTNDADADDSGEYAVFKCHQMGPISTPLAHNGDQILSVSLVGMPDRDRTRGRRIWRHGHYT